MKSLFIVFALFAAVAFAAVPNSGNTWVVLVAGNSGWNSDSYATQSSMYKLYQTIKQAGISDLRIFPFFADDIAYNENNPFPGQVYNEPYFEGGSNVNVYEGIKNRFYYIEKYATREYFLKLFTRDGYIGNFNPTAYDNVFVYLVGHNNNDGFVMPAGDNVLTGDDIYYAISNFTAKKMYNKLMFFVDADHSNSLLWHANYWDYFDNVYFVSSTDSSHSSEGTTTYDPYIRLNLKRPWTDYFTNLLIQKGLNMTIEDLYNEIYSPYNNYPCQSGDSYVKNMTLGDFIHGAKSEYRTGSNPIYPHSEICNDYTCNTNSCDCFAICKRRGYDDSRCKTMCCRLSGCLKS